MLERHSSHFTEKCFCIDRDIYNLLKNNDFLNKTSYDCKQKLRNFETSLEFSFSKFLLDNNIEYSSIDNNKITKLDILKHYKQNNFTELFEITKNYFKVCDSNIPKKIFWTSSTMKKIEEDKNFINLLNKNRDPNNLKKW